MCSHYESIEDGLLDKYFKAYLRSDPQRKLDLWPRYPGLFIRLPKPDTYDDAIPEREAIVGRWGMVPASAKAINEKLSTFNAKTETADKLYTFRGAFHRGQRCIIPARAIYEPDWRSGKAVATRFTRTDGEPMGIAGLWDQWISAGGEAMESYTMFTISAADHDLFKHYHRPEKEKRQVVILPAGAYDDWLHCEPSQTKDFLRAYPADRLTATAV
ncbi:SOS response-associated peptidase [Eoetvoesiella caeni]